jgi:hypothetical protein
VEGDARYCLPKVAHLRVTPPSRIVASPELCLTDTLGRSGPALYRNAGRDAGKSLKGVQEDASDGGGVRGEHHHDI